jgi:DnaJ-class molecular chaperone
MALGRKSRKSQKRSNKTARKRHVHRGGAVCPTCRGSGGYNRTFTCPGCDGTGGHMEEVTDFRGKLVRQWQNCLVCRGAKVMSEFVACGTCYGSGTVPDPEPEQKGHRGRYRY